MSSEVKLDITGYLELGKDLAKRIQGDVARTQTGFMTDLPNTLYLTNAQFDMLMGLQNQRSYMSAINMKEPGQVKKAYIYYTPHNAMDVVIVDEEKSNLPEAGLMKWVMNTTQWTWLTANSTES